MPRLKTAAHEAFARAYVRELNATAAARQVWPKMKPASLWAHASRLLRNVKVQRRIEELFESKQERLDISVDRYDRELAAIAFVDPADVLEWDASGVHVRDWNKIGTLDRRAIQEISIDKTGAKRVKFHTIWTMNNSAWCRARERAELPQVRVHDLKHTFGRRLRAAGVSFEDRQDLLGHKSGRITTHYSKAEIQNLIEAAERVCGEEGSRKTPALVLLKGGGS